MKRDFKTRALIGTIIISVILIGCLIYKMNQNEEQCETQKSSSYDMSLYQLTEHVQNVENFLAKSTISSSSEAGAESLTHVWKEADTAVNYLSQIPLNVEQLNKTAKFLNQVSEYSYSLSRKNIYKEALTQEELDNLKMLHKYSVQLKDSLNDMEEKISIGEISWDDIQKNEGTDYTRQVDNLDEVSFTDIDKNFNEFEGLIYDGAFSEHIELQDKKGLPDTEITEDEAVEKIKQILGKNPENLNKKGKIDKGDIAVYQFEVTDENQEVTEIAISVKGGKLVLLNKDREVVEENLTREDANKIGKDYLASIDFPNMQESYFQTQENIITVNYVYKQGDILVYPDLIKVKIALDNGEILGVETNGYLNSHTERTDTVATITKEEAKATLNKNLDIQSESLIIIPTEWKTEILCYEFKGKIDETEFLVYVNAKNGREENILVIRETPGGILTM